VPTTDLSSHAPWLESQRRSRARRFEAARRLRRLRGRRSLAVVTLASLSLAAGGALAAGGSTGSQAVQSAGTSVAALQQALGIPADGVYGPQTRRAVRQFQAARGLVVDGIAGPQTLGALGLSSGAGSAGSSGSSASAVLERIAQCESGGDPTTDTGNGYYGKYQFSLATWHRMGGAGNPARASEAEQDRIAARLYAQEGAAPWPVCGA
jgi:lysozyme family protein